MDNQIEEAIVKIIHEITARDERIEKSTLIYDDLKIAGTDAGDLLEEVSRKFGTSFAGFYFQDYFPDETEAMLFRIYLFFGGRKKKPLSVGHLIAVVERGSWFEP